jgi:hypothetical protein
MARFPLFHKAKTKLVMPVEKVIIWPAKLIMVGHNQMDRSDYFNYFNRTIETRGLTKLISAQCIGNRGFVLRHSWTILGVDRQRG